MIRSIQTADANAVQTIMKQCFVEPEVYSPEVVENYCTRGQGYTYINNIYMAGFALVETRPCDIPSLLRSSDSTNVLTLTMLAVSPIYRRQGIGSALLQHITNRVKVPMYLHVRKSNVNAQALYKKFGFQHVATLKDYYDGPEDAYYLRRDPPVQRFCLPDSHMWQLVM